MSLLRTVISLICIQRIHAISPCVFDSDCDPNHLCSPADLFCYQIFNASDYANFSISSSPDAATLTPVTSLTLEDVLDHDESTFISLNNNIFYHIDFTLNGSYWVHDMVLKMSSSGILNWYVNGVTETTSVDSAPPGSLITLQPNLYPLRVTNVSFLMRQTIAFDIFDLSIAGAYDTPIPTKTPTQAPTEDTDPPSSAPSFPPSVAPSAAPTAYPTPDVCEEYLITQSCCGHFGYQIEDDKVNIRNESLTSCRKSFVTECCGTFGDLVLSGSSYGCGQALLKTEYSPTEAFCHVSYLNTSVNNTDDIVGTIINGTNVLYDESKADINDIYSFCRCEWTTYECQGVDMAMCGTEQTWNDLFDLECWDNETTWSAYDDFTNETCWKDTLAADASLSHLLSEPCSFESFIGSVTSIESISSELIHDGECQCTYSIRDCQILEDQSKTQCNYNKDCANNGECNQELAAPCCGYDGYGIDGYGGVTPQLDDNKYPVDDTWQCNNDKDALCPDIFDGTRQFSVESRVDWWFDGDEEILKERCGCLYITDECNLPTQSPTVEPTVIPTTDPTAPPSEGDEDEDKDNASIITISFVVMLYPYFFM